jgi:hypothetical protein
LVPIKHVQDIWFNALVDINLADTNINTESFTDYITEYWGVMEKTTLGDYTWEDAVCSVADCNLII